jgi:hypothetical protein
MANEQDQLVSGNATDTANKNEEKGKPDFVASLPPGSLIGTDWSKSPALDLKESHISSVKDLLKKQMNKEMAARREEILRVWEAELFWRGYQHLLPSTTGFGWEFAGAGSGYGRGEQYQRSMFETNFYLSYGLSVVNALTRKVPTVRFEPNCPQEDTDITAADAANKLVDLVKRNNDLLSLMGEMARFLYTDGRVSFYTRYVKDGQRFGFKEPNEKAALDTEEASAEAAGHPPIGENEQTPAEEAAPVEGPKEPKGQQVITVHGALEVKYPMKVNCQAEAGWLLWSVERDVSVAQGMYPKKSEKIKVYRGGPAGDDIDRLARVNTKLGVEDNFVTSDSECYDTTIQNAWLRDCTLLEIKDDQVKQELLEMSKGVGLRFTFCGEEFIECKQESLDDHWTLVFALPGDGVHRPGLGTSYIPAQKIVNNLLELRNDYLINGIPMKYMDNETFDVEHIKDQTNTPGGVRPFVYTPGVPAAELVWVEPTLQFPQGLNEAIEDMGKGQTAQILTGVFPALSGDDTGNNDTGIGMRMQRDNALGRVGIPWRNIKAGIASVMMQAVQCLAINHDEDIVLAGLEKGSDPIIVELQDLKGQYHCEPDTDENYPESWTDIQQRVTDLLDPNKTNPAFLEDINSPQNWKFLKRAFGLTELVIPKEVSFEKQLGEIEEMKKGRPLPNPALGQVQEQLAKATEAVQTNPGDPQAAQQVQQLQQQLNTLPKEVSSVTVDKDADDNQTEADTCLGWIRGAVGRAFKNGTNEQQLAYENIHLHFVEHNQLAAEDAKTKKQVPERGVTKSVSAGDLMKAGVSPEQAVQILQSI